MVYRKKKEKDRLIDINEVAKLLNISKSHLYKRVAPRAKNPFPIKPTRIGNRLRFSEQKVQDFIRKGR